MEQAGKQAGILILQHVTVCQQVTFYHHVQKIELPFFLLLQICVQFEKEKKFLSTVILNSGKYYIYQIESIGLRQRMCSDIHKFYNWHFSPHPSLSAGHLKFKKLMCEFG